VKILVDSNKLVKVAELLEGPPDSGNITYAYNIVAKILRESITEEQKEIELDEYLAQTQRDWMD
jgi:hypothetical protein